GGSQPLQNAEGHLGGGQHGAEPDRHDAELDDDAQDEPEGRPVAASEAIFEPGGHGRDGAWAGRERNGPGSGKEGKPGGQRHGGWGVCRDLTDSHLAEQGSLRGGVAAACRFAAPRVTASRTRLAAAVRPPSGAAAARGAALPAAIAVALTACFALGVTLALGRGGPYDGCGIPIRDLDAIDGALDDTLDVLEQLDLGLIDQRKRGTRAAGAT